MTQKKTVIAANHFDLKIMRQEKQTNQQKNMNRTEIKRAAKRKAEPQFEFMKINMAQ